MVIKEAGGKGNKNTYEIFLSDCIIIHQYINTQSHLLHTLSLPLSLSPSHPHTHTPHLTTPHHTHSYTEQTRQI